MTQPSEPNAAPAQEQQPPDPQNQQQQDPPAKSETDWKAEARKWEQRAKDNAATAKANADAAKRLADIEEANKSEAQKQADRIAAAEKAAEQSRLDAENARAEALRVTIAAEKGLPPKLAKRLTGSTREEIEADADDLLDVAPPGPRAPLPNRQQGTPQRPATGSLQSGRELYEASKPKT